MFTFRNDSNKVSVI